MFVFYPGLLQPFLQYVSYSHRIFIHPDPLSAGRFLENLVKSTRDKVAGYTKAFEDMEKEFETEVFEGTYIVTTIILGEVKDMRDDVKDLRNDVKDLSKSWYSDSQLATCTTCNLHDLFRR